MGARPILERTLCSGGCSLPGLHSRGSDKRISGASMAFESVVSKLTGSSKDCHGATGETRGEDPARSRRPAPPPHLGELLRPDCYPTPGISPLHCSSPSCLPCWWGRGNDSVEINTIEKNPIQIRSQSQTANPKSTVAPKSTASILG